MKRYLLLSLVYVVGCVTQANDPIARMQGTWLSAKDLAWPELRTGDVEYDEQIMKTMRPNAGHVELTFEGLVLISRDLLSGTEYQSTNTVVESGSNWVLLDLVTGKYEADEKPRPLRLELDGDVLWIIQSNGHVACRDGFRRRDREQKPAHLFQEVQ